MLIFSLILSSSDEEEEEDSDSETPSSTAKQMAQALAGDDEYPGRDSGCTCILAFYQVF